MVENKWRAQRYGVHGTFVTDDGAVTVAEMLDRVIEETAADADALGCADEIRRCRAIVGAGTSADAQLAVFEAHERRRGRDEALARRHRLDRRARRCSEPKPEDICSRPRLPVLTLAVYVFCTTKTHNGRRGGIATQPTWHVGKP